MFSKILKIYFILCIFGFSIFAGQQQEGESHERSLSRQKRLLVYPQYTVWQLSMALVSKVSYIDSHRVAINSGFVISYNLPYNLSNFYKAPYFRSMENSISPIYQFIKKLAESDDTSVPETSKNLVPTELPIVNDDENSENRNDVENSTNENLELVDDNEVTTTETETTTKNLKKKKKSKVKRDITAAELYSGVKDILKVSGYHDDCLLKSICELARHPLGDHDHDLVYEVLEFILTPSLHQGFDPETEDLERKIYEEAEEIGRCDGDCELIYASCENSPLSTITNLINNEVYY